MTAVEWLIDQIKNDQNQKALSAKEWLEVFEQAKKIEAKQQQKMVDDALTNYELGWADRKKQFSLYEHKETITSADTKVSTSFLENTPTSSKTEISDEEIEKAADKYVSEDEFNRLLECFEQGAKWYREQLKIRQ